MHKFVKLGLPALLVAIVLSACATRSPQPQVEAAPVPTPASEEKNTFVPLPPPSRAIRNVALRPSVEDTPVVIIPTAQPTRAEQIIRLVRNGGLIQADKNTLVFSKFRVAPKNSSSLYEDAVTLGRLRRQLKQVRNLPESVYSSATVNAAKAYLTLDDEIPCDPAAEAIDAALKTEGVTSVHARLFGPVRL